MARIENGLIIFKMENWLRIMIGGEKRSTKKNVIFDIDDESHHQNERRTRNSILFSDFW